MPAFSRLLLVASSLFLSSAAWAQRREVNDPVYVPEVQVELGLKGSDYVLTTFSLIPNSRRGVGTFAGGHLRIGYEHFRNERWSYGATLRVLGGGEFIDGYGDFFGMQGNAMIGALLRHTGTIGSVNFGQRLGLDFATNLDLNTGAARNRDRAFTRLRLDVDRLFPLGNKLAVRPRLAYEVATYLRFQREEDQTKERVIDFGNLRAEAGLRLSPHFDLTPWVAAQTQYLNSLPQFDSNGNQVRGGRTNIIVPTLGLDLRLTLLANAANPERRQLPTQH